MGGGCSLDSVNESLKNISQTLGKPTAQSVKFTQITTSEICKIYLQNEARAVQEYRNRVVKITATLTQIIPDMAINLKSGNDMITYKITNQSDMDKLVNLQKGKSYNLIGEIILIDRNYMVTNGCTMGLKGISIE